jgi:hypothetical protein
MDALRIRVPLIPPRSRWMRLFSGLTHGWMVW